MPTWMMFASGTPAARATASDVSHNGDARADAPASPPTDDEAGSTIAAETRLLERARDALRRGDTNATLAALDAHISEFPHGVLLDEARGNQVVIDSRLIVTYLYEQARAPLPAAPESRLAIQPTLFRPEKRYYDENVLLVLDGAIDSAINVFLLELDGISREKSAYLQRQMERIGSCLSWLDALLAGRPTLHEGSFSYFDIAMVCALEWMLFRQRYPVLDHPHLAQFLERHASRPTLAATHPRHAANAGPPRISR